MKDKYKDTVCVARFCTVHKYTLIHASTREREREKGRERGRERGSEREREERGRERERVGGGG